MGEFAESLRTAPAAPVTAYDANERLVTIHPFSDGNGRTARLLMNLLLLRVGYPPLVIRPEDRPEYLDALDATRAGDRPAYHEFLDQRLEAALDNILMVLKLGANCRSLDGVTA